MLIFTSENGKYRGINWAGLFVLFHNEVRHVATFVAFSSYGKKLKEAKKLEFLQCFLGGSFFGALYGAVYVTYAVAFWWGPKEFLKGNMKIMEVFTVMFSVVFGSLSLAQAGPVFGIVTAGSASYHFLKSIMNRVILLK